MEEEADEDDADRDENISRKPFFSLVVPLFESFIISFNMLPIPCSDRELLDLCSPGENISSRRRDPFCRIVDCFRGVPISLFCKAQADQGEEENFPCKKSPT